MDPVTISLIIGTIASFLTSSISLLLQLRHCHSSCFNCCDLDFDNDGNNDDNEKQKIN